MIASLILRRTVPSLVARRQITTSTVKRSSDPVIGHIDQGAQPGKVSSSTSSTPIRSTIDNFLHLFFLSYFSQNLPFDINNRYKLAFYMILYFGSAFSLPFIAVRYQLLKKNSA